MPASPAMVAPAQPAQDRRQGGNAPVALIPFVRAADEHVEPILDLSVQLDANPHPVGGVVDVPSFGFLRSLVVQVNATGGTGAAAVAHEDAPWGIISEIAVQDIAGSYIFGPLSGHDLYLACKYGGTAGWFADPALNPSFSAVAATGNFAFLIRVPLEISLRDALGALPNQNSASTYKLRITMGNNASVYTTNPTTSPSVRFRVSAEEWTPPDAADLAGRAQETVPPDMGTTMFWTKSPRNVNAGNQTVRLDRVGNLIRELILVYRQTATGLRDTVDFPDPLQLTWDNHNIFNAYRDIIRAYMYERYGYTTLETGVFVLDFIHEMAGKAGNELRDLWMPTTQASRIDLVGNFVLAGTVSILTCDVQPVGDVYAGESMGRP
jgi:hypothetical protein